MTGQAVPGVYGPEQCPPQAPAPTATTGSDDDLYGVLDSLHGQVLRAKYRLRENPDADVLANLVGDIVDLAKLTETKWQRHVAATS